MGQTMGDEANRSVGPFCVYSESQGENCKDYLN